jgi:hypothetical protein
MTIAVSLKVNDGLVLAADSASTIMGVNGIENVYNNANKVFNLRKGLPIGLITWGLGGLGGLSISTLAKDLRLRLMGADPDYAEWHLDPANYTIEEVAGRVREFFYEEHYEPVASAYQKQKKKKDRDFTPLGLIVAGYSAGSTHGEEHLFQFTAQGCDGPTLLNEPEVPGIFAGGQPEIVYRVMDGFSPALGNVLVDFGLDPKDVPDALAHIAGEMGSPLINPAMPFQDAIELAEWLVGLAIGYSRFMPGAPTVGGPIETAAISKHEGFKWVRHKHYFDARLNPMEGKGH